MCIIRIAAIAVAFLIGLMLADAAFSQGVPCGETSDIAEALTERYGETVVDTQVNPETGHVQELWGNAETGSWTLTISTPDGWTCLLDAGFGFTLGEPGDPA